jgi:hypothetical protein
MFQFLTSLPKRVVLWMLLTILLLLPLALQARAALETHNAATGSYGVADIERLSVGTGGIESNGSAFFSYLSADNRYVTFHSWATNFGGAHGDPNWLDVYYRDRLTNTTIKISNGYDGNPTTDDSFDAIITADGRYVVYNSYAWNIVPGDTNRSEWLRDGLDVFLYDAHTGVTERVSLTHTGEEIQANSFGTITGDGEIIYFVTPGTGVTPDYPGGSPQIYRRHRDSYSSVERVLNVEPNDRIVNLWPSHDGRFLVFSSAASNLVPGDTNGLPDIFLFDYVTKELRLVSRPPGGGQSNGLSGQGLISQDGRYVIFRSFATNLVPGDNNGHADIFVYDRLSGNIERVSVSSSGEQANGGSRDPSICGDGRFVSFSSDATNLVANDTNGIRDIFVRDRQTGVTFIASVNADGEQTNDLVHRSYLTTDCRYITYASDGDNLVPGDTNNARDLFMARIVTPADFSASRAMLTMGAPGETTTFRATLINSGLETGQATLLVPIPQHTTLEMDSLPPGAVYEPAEDRVAWQGEIAGESQVVVSFDLTIDETLVDFTIIETAALLTGDGQEYTLRALTVVNGINTYLPFIGRP